MIIILYRHEKRCCWNMALYKKYIIIIMQHSYLTSLSFTAPATVLSGRVNVNIYDLYRLNAKS